MQENERFDVAILGAGIGGTMLAAILARQGKRVLVLEKGSHPRFAVGEALLPQSTLWMWIMAQRFDVPEIQHLTRTDSIHKHVGPTCGIKRALGFLYHEEGTAAGPEEIQPAHRAEHAAHQREPSLPPGRRPLHAERGDELRRRLPR